MKIAFSLITILLIAVVISCLALKLLFGARFDLRHSKMQTNAPNKDAPKQAPLGVARIIARNSADVADNSVQIHAFNDIYAALGVGKREFSQWERKHGMDSLGVDEEGNLFVPGYPVLSKVAWMYIDPVTLTSAETSALIQECHQAIINSPSESAKHELEAISFLAERALSNSAVVQFGYP